MDLQLIVDKLREFGMEKVHVKGQNVMCVCPFHPDRNPSFGIHPEKGGNCFACNTKFPNADATLAAIAKKKGIEYTAIYTEFPVDYDFLPEEEVEPEPLNPRSLKYYKKDVEYFEEHWNVSKSVATNRQLCIDPYSGAECFPIFDNEGNYWGNVERHAPSGGGRSRYHYPPNFPRARILLGEDTKADEVWLVEGVRDLCAIETKLGVSAVALGGAKASEEQISKLREYDQVILALDNDRAGRQGRDYLIDRIGGLLVAQFDGKDPMEAMNFEVEESGINWLQIG